MKILSGVLIGVLGVYAAIELLIAGLFTLISAVAALETTGILQALGILLILIVPLMFAGAILWAFNVHLKQGYAKAIVISVAALVALVIVAFVTLGHLPTSIPNVLFMLPDMSFKLIGYLVPAK